MASSKALLVLVIVLSVVLAVSSEAALLSSQEGAKEANNWRFGQGGGHGRTHRLPRRMGVMNVMAIEVVVVVGVAVEEEEGDIHRRRQSR
ncbi:hypothetical protein MLD38_035318 [Melastoma candidum]|uniref:Uncharacterized protein n=1 Tax=Melastoma candidum TaxID=119954 RepID=A0ACB9MEA6_9MYRT|nr:hypothetical protein MLD38_035318 [Melastoma candidum]